MEGNELRFLEGERGVTGTALRAYGATRLIEGKGGTDHWAVTDEQAISPPAD